MRSLGFFFFFFLLFGCLRMLLTRREIMSSWFKYGTRCVSVFVFFFLSRTFFGISACTIVSTRQTCFFCPAAKVYSKDIATSPKIGEESYIVYEQPLFSLKYLYTLSPALDYATFRPYSHIGSLRAFRSKVPVDKEATSQQMAREMLRPGR